MRPGPKCPNCAEPFPLWRPRWIGKPIRCARCDTALIVPMWYAHLGAALPVGLSAGGAEEPCRQAAAGDRYALQCGTPSRSVAAGPDLRDRTCVTRPSVTARGAVSFEDACTVGGQEVRNEGLKIRLGGDD